MFFIKERIMALGIDHCQGGVFLVVQNLVEMQSLVITIFIVQKYVIKIGKKR